jgi:hypothetical protein
MRYVKVYWTHCPNCDAELGVDVKVFVGDYWECPECGDSGTRQPGQYDTAPLTRWASWDWDTTESIPALYGQDDELSF